MRLPYAAALDPATPGRALLRLVKSSHAHERAAALGNPSLPAAVLVREVFRGSLPALYNPALPTLVRAGGDFDVEDSDVTSVTPARAVLACLLSHLGGAASHAPMRFQPELTAWLAAAAMGASRWYAGDMLDLLCDNLLELIDIQDRSAEDRLGEGARSAVTLAGGHLIGALDAPFCLVLYDRLLAAGLPDGAREHMAAVRHAAGLLGLSAQGSAVPREQMALFDESMGGAR